MDGMEGLFKAVEKMISSMGENVPHSQEELEKFLEEQYATLFADLIPEGHPMRGVLKKALGMGNEAATDALKRGYEGIIREKDKAYDRLLEYLHSKGHKPEEEMTGTNSDDIPVAHSKLVPDDRPAWLQKLIDKGILTEEDLNDEE